MTLMIKLCAFSGVLLNFLGSLMLLKDFRDIIQLPFYRWRNEHIHKQINLHVEKRGGFPTQFIWNPMRSVFPRGQFGLLEILRADPVMRDFMRLSNEHDGLRRSLHLKPFPVIDAFTFNSRALHESFKEIGKELDVWAAQPDPESSTDRTKALKLFISGFALLTAAAFLDLVLYLFVG